jgi:DNA-binding GntR family transcriptional regulator
VLTQVLRQRDVHLDRDFGPDGKEHLRIARALKSGDGAAAAERLSGHLLRIMDQLLITFAQEAETAAAAEDRPVGMRFLV